jgi:shikimate 5-dehydrogenase
MSENKAKLSRRNFLLAVGAGGAASAAAIVAKTAAQGLPVTPANDKKTSKGYQASAHVRNYYRTAKV